MFDSESGNGSHDGPLGTIDAASKQQVLKSIHEFREQCRNYLSAYSQAPFQLTCEDLDRSAQGLCDMNLQVLRAYGDGDLILVGNPNEAFLELSLGTSLGHLNSAFCAKDQVMERQSRLNSRTLALKQFRTMASRGWNFQLMVWQRPFLSSSALRIKGVP